MMQITRFNVKDVFCGKHVKVGGGGSDDDDDGGGDNNDDDDDT
jgi:hypothetical protein